MFLFSLWMAVEKAARAARAAKVARVARVARVAFRAAWGSLLNGFSCLC